METSKSKHPNDEIPEDLGIKIGSEEEAFWTNAKDKLERESRQAEYEIQINSHVIKLCNEKIKKEQLKKMQTKPDYVD